MDDAAAPWPKTQAARSGILPGLGDLMGGLDALAERALDRSIRLAVTGLSRSGKTVLNTTLVHHLLGGHELPFLEAVHSGRYLGARLLPPRPGDPPAFPFERMRASLTAPTPQWPKPTDRLTMLRLELRFRPANALVRQITPIQRLRVELVDYPGEWLLDLPLLEQDFSRWSAATLALSREPPRDALARDWLDAVEGLDPAAGAEAVEPLVARYRACLLRCRDEAGLSLLQPGRLTMPGELEGSDLPRFTPLPEDAPSDLRLAMQARYERYRDEVVAPFWRDHVSRFDRQLVLIDLLTVLNRGPSAFADTGRALEAVLSCFRYGASGWLWRLFRPRIDKLLFAATKADHVAANQHANLRHLLLRMVEEAGRAPRLEGIATETLAISALRSTDSVRTQHQGQTLSCVKGVLERGRRETVLFPGEIPPDLPEPEDWASGRFRFEDFAPRRLWLHGARQPQHIRLDQVLESLLGDRLR